jgi:Tol biopolymer transport system component/DNA-binding winged helix-turn-helix (wHTH) protein
MSPPRGTVRFDAFEVDLSAGELRKRGVRIKLSDQPFQILVALLERPGEIVTREQLRVRLWPDGTFVDFEHSLNSSVNKLREALGDTASAPRYIQTVPRKGYRFACEIQPETRAVAPQPEGRRKPTIWVAVAGLAFLAIAAIAVIAMAMKAPQQQALEVVPLTTSPGSELQPSFSPDGNYVAYTARADIFVKQVGGDSIRRLTTDPAPDVSPKWSPDGRHIAFARLLSRTNLPEAAILTVPAMGGPERLITKIRVRMIIGSASYLDWFPDSENLVISEVDAEHEQNALSGLSIRTGERWRLTDPPSRGTGDVDPAVSPDGRNLAFARVTGIERPSQIYVLKLSNARRAVGVPDTLTPQQNSRAPAWMPSGRELIFSSGAQHRKRLVRMEVGRPGTEQPLPFAAEGSMSLSAAISRNGDLTYPVFHGDVELIRTELRNDGRPVGNGTHFISSTFVDHLPDFSPDGRQVAFISNRTGSQQVWVADANGGSVRQLTSLPVDLEATWPRWSPDGRRIAFSTEPGVQVADIETGRVSMRIKDLGTEGSPEWSPDGKWLYVPANREGKVEIWRIPSDPAAGDEMVQVTKGGGANVRVSRYDGFIYYTKGRSPVELWRVSPAGGAETRLLEGVSNGANFFPARNGIYYIPSITDVRQTRIMLVDVRTGEREIAVRDAMPQWGLAVSPDGRTILHTENSGAMGSDLMLVRGFR